MTNLKYLAQRATVLLGAVAAYAAFFAEGGKRW